MTEEISLETVAIVYDRINDRVLLGMKKRGFGTGKWNGLGGKFDSTKDKTLKDTAQRVLFEESAGLNGIVITEMGVIAFRFPEKPEEKAHEVHFYRVDSYVGETLETEEISLKWFSIKEIPYSQMWPDDSIWMPMILKGKKFRGEMDFNASGEIIRNTLKIVGSL